MMTIIMLKSGKLPIEMNMNEVSQELGSTSEVTEPPPPIPPKRMGMSCNGKIFENHDSSTRPKGMRPPPPLPAVEALPSLPPKTKLALLPRLDAECHYSCMVY